MTAHQKTYEQLVAHFGGQQRTANALGCTQPSVWAWLQGNACMSAVLALKAERLTGGEFCASDLCPALADIKSVKQIVQPTLNH